MKILKLLFCLFLLFFTFRTTSAQYTLQSQVMGITAQTSNDLISSKSLSTTGQTFIGSSSNNSLSNTTGFWYLADKMLSELENPFENVPQKFELFQNYPNPFNPLTTIKFALPTVTNVRIDIFNILGQNVLTLLNEKKAPGYHTVVLNGNHISSGMYFYTIKAENFYEIKRMLLIK